LSVCRRQPCRRTSFDAAARLMPRRWARSAKLTQRSITSSTDGLFDGLSDG
jgi:hypothetical protein